MHKLTKLKSRHKDVIRRLVVGESIPDIALELGISPISIRNWIKSDVFALELARMENAMRERTIERKEIMEIIEETAKKAALLCDNAVDGAVKGADGNITEVPIALRLKAAWDAMDRAGHSEVKKSMVAVFDPVQLIIQAYNEKHKAIETQVEEK